MSVKAGTGTLARTAGSITGALFLAAMAAAAAAQEPAESLALQLNGLAPSENGCLMTFVVKNDLKNPLEKASFEMVLFDQKGLVDRMTVFEFSDLPQGKTKVQQFDLPGADCGKVSRVLVNDASECTGKGVPQDACITRLTTETKSEVAFGS